ncbi:GntR family transcriptional regulator, partial [Oleiphilus sp. HI0125]
MKLPSERELSEQHSTTRVTIREALKLLETEGLIYRENRRGWFISPPKLRYDPSVHGRVSFVDYARQQGFQPSTQLLSIKLTVADRYIASEMQIAVG